MPELGDLSALKDEAHPSAPVAAPLAVDGTVDNMGGSPDDTDLAAAIADCRGPVATCFSPNSVLRLV